MKCSKWRGWIGRWQIFQNKKNKIILSYIYKIISLLGFFAAQYQIIHGDCCRIIISFYWSTTKLLCTKHSSVDIQVRVEELELLIFHKLETCVKKSQLVLNHQHQHIAKFILLLRPDVMINPFLIKWLVSVTYIPATIKPSMVCEQASCVSVFHFVRDQTCVLIRAIKNQTDE